MWEILRKKYTQNGIKPKKKQKTNLISQLHPPPAIVTCLHNSQSEAQKNSPSDYAQHQTLSEPEAVPGGRLVLRNLFLLRDRARREARRAVQPRRAPARVTGRQTLSRPLFLQFSYSYGTVSQGPLHGNGVGFFLKAIFTAVHC